MKGREPAAVHPLTALHSTSAGSLNHLLFGVFLKGHSGLSRSEAEVFCCFITSADCPNDSVGSWLLFFLILYLHIKTLHWFIALCISIRVTRRVFQPWQLHQCWRFGTVAGPQSRVSPAQIFTRRWQLEECPANSPNAGHMWVASRGGRIFFKFIPLCVCVISRKCVWFCFCSMHVMDTLPDCVCVCVCVRLCVRVRVWPDWTQCTQGHTSALFLEHKYSRCVGFAAGGWGVGGIREEAAGLSSTWREWTETVTACTYWHWLVCSVCHSSVTLQDEMRGQEVIGCRGSSLTSFVSCF